MYGSSPFTCGWRVDGDTPLSSCGYTSCDATWDIDLAERTKGRGPLSQNQFEVGVADDVVVAVKLSTSMNVISSVLSLNGYKV